MGMCKKCGKVFNTIDMTDGVCTYCLNPDVKLVEEQARAKLRQEEERLQSELNVVGKENQERLKSIFITTETALEMLLAKRVKLITAQRIYGINIMKDLFSFVRDIVGGRINSLENALAEASVEIMDDLKRQAFLLYGDAVIAVKIEHTYNNANNGSILSVFATGTVVLLEKTIKCYECGKDLLNTETSCPHCGAPTDNQ